MKCPIDQTDLVMSERQGVEIDYCPQCRGVWLDRGELDKILDRAAEQAGVGARGTGPVGVGGRGAPGPTPAQPTYPAPPDRPTHSPYPTGPADPFPHGPGTHRRAPRSPSSPPSAPSAPSPGSWGRRGHDDRGGRDAYGRPTRRRRESWLGELFDF